MTTLALLAAPGRESQANEYAAEYRWSDQPVEATDGDPFRKTRVLGPIRTHGDYQHGVKALKYGSADIIGATVHTAGNDAHGVYYSGAARLFITGATITTRGNRAHALGGFDERGDDVPDWAYGDTGELRMARSTLILEGEQSHGLHAIGRTGPIHLGHPLAAPDDGPGAAKRPDIDVWIVGRSARNTAIHAVAARNITFNGVQAMLFGPSSTGILARENASVLGRNLWLYSYEQDSVGLDATGRRPCTVSAQGARCDHADTTLHVTRGRVHMHGARSPAVELRRADVHLRDVSLGTGPLTPYTVGNEAGRFRFEGGDTRPTLRSHGASLRAWVGSPTETAIFQLSRADVHSAGGMLLQVARQDGAEPLRPGRTYYTVLKLNDARATGAVYGIPQARAHIQLNNRSAWRGHTDIGGHVRIAGGSAWAMDADSDIDRLTMSGPATLRFVGSERRAPDRPRFHTLSMQHRLAGRGRFEMRTALDEGRGDRLDIRGAAHGAHAVFITDFSKPGADAAPRALPLITARRGKASFTLDHPGQTLDVRGRRYTLVKRRTPAGLVWALERDGADADTSSGAGANQDRQAVDAAGAPSRKNDGASASPAGADHDDPSSPAGSQPDRTDIAGDGPYDANGDNPYDANGDDPYDANGDDGGADATTGVTDEGDLASESGISGISGLGGVASAPLPLPRPIQAALVNNGGIATASTLWDATMRPMGDRMQMLRTGDDLADMPEATAPAQGSGVWIRGIDNRQHWHQGLGGAYTQSIWGYTLGADRAVNVMAGRWRLGVTVSQLDAHRGYDDGKGRSAAVLFGAYASLRLHNGAYASVAASGGRFRHTVQARGAQDEDHAIGRYRHPGAGVAVAAGRRVALANDWFVEPGASLAYFRAGGARYTLSDGTAVRDRGGHALQSRVGLHAGRRIELHNGGAAAPYVRLGWLREYGNRGRVQADGATLRTDLSGDRFDIGAGVQAHVGRRHFMYADVDIGKGRHLSHSRAIVAGYQYRW